MWSNSCLPTDALFWRGTASFPSVPQNKSVPLFLNFSYGFISGYVPVSSWPRCLGSLSRWLCGDGRLRHRLGVPVTRRPPGSRSTTKMVSLLTFTWSFTFHRKNYRVGDILVGFTRGFSHIGLLPKSHPWSFKRTIGTPPHGISFMS